MIREELIISLKKEITQLERLVRQSSSSQGSKATTLDILQNIERKLNSQSIKLNDFDAIASTLIRNFDSLREFVVGDECKFSMLEAIIGRISKLRSLTKDDLE